MPEREPTLSSVTVVVPTYRRPGPLIDCIRSIVEGRLLPGEIIVVGRTGDDKTSDALVQAQEICSGKTVLRVGWVATPGHLPPVQKGLELAANQIVAFVDDDVTVTPDWINRLMAPFADKRVGVVGGQVITPATPLARIKGKPGCVSWYGKHWGNVAALRGEFALDVDGVMECNWAWRRTALNSLQFDSVLNFDDASMYGLDLCLQAKSKGCRVVYEPRALVYHHVAPRVPDLDRSDRCKRSFAYSRNYTYIMLKHLPVWQRLVFLVWWFLIGERGSWGLLSLLADTLSGRPPRLSSIRDTLMGKIEGIVFALRAPACESRPALMI